ncbi:hypothetical protein C2134_00710 [Chromobacterium sinusclupearum]|uniref:Uncharacterized protein n=1 Tax=Chromobacterium sinusclupearum TaxID=2077146 RepID=A0A2K4MUG8_9NEIS|nr:hypothetical protein C2134_00710 [Chromobacterium sinusclupearum]
MPIKVLPNPLSAMAARTEQLDRQSVVVSNRTAVPLGEVLKSCSNTTSMLSAAAPRGSAAGELANFLEQGWLQFLSHLETLGEECLSEQEAAALKDIRQSAVMKSRMSGPSGLDVAGNLIVARQSGRMLS